MDGGHEEASLMLDDDGLQVLSYLFNCLKQIRPICGVGVTKSYKRQILFACE
jgi:hypothetical protein